MISCNGVRDLARELTLLTWLLNLASKMVASRVPCSSGMAAIASYLAASSSLLFSRQRSRGSQLRNKCSCDYCNNYVLKLMVCSGAVMACQFIVSFRGTNVRTGAGLVMLQRKLHAFTHAPAVNYPE